MTMLTRTLSQVLLLTLSATGGSVCIGQVQESVDELKRSIEGGNHHAVYRLGRLDDASHVPFLLKIKEKPRISSEMRIAVRDALARLGHEESFQEVVKELKSPDRDVGHRVFEKLRYIGGRRTVAFLYKLLDDPTPSWVDHDAIYPSFSNMAAKTLRDLVPNPPELRGVETYSLEGTARYVKEWKEWFAKHPEWLKPEGPPDPQKR